MPQLFASTGNTGPDFSEKVRLALIFWLATKDGKKAKMKHEKAIKPLRKLFFRNIFLQ